MPYTIPNFATQTATQYKANIDAAFAALTTHTRKNRLKNGGFAVDQRVNSATSRADDTYGLDCWYTLTETAAIQVTQQADQEVGQPFNIRLNQNQAAAQRMGAAQIIEARDSKGDRSKAMVLSSRIRCSSSQPIRYAILEWTGTQDVVTSDVVLSWTNGTYTAGNFFLAANLVVTAVGSITPTAATWTPITELTGVLGASVNNQIVFFWTEGTAAQNVTLDIGLVQLEPGTVSTEFEYRPFEQELALCQRYLPVIRVFDPTGEDIGHGQCHSTTNALIRIPFDVETRVNVTGATVANPTNFNLTVAAGTLSACTALANTTGHTKKAGILAATVAAVLAAGNATRLIAGNINCQVLFTGAEL